jgi:4-amino-4-deoxy-L-arabinose transferase-like glycosyltransferase
VSKVLHTGVAQRHFDWRWLMLSTIPLILAAALRYPSLFEPRWYGDEGIFAAIGQSIRHGEALYSQVWDNKPPLIFFSYAFVQGAFGSGVFALHLVASMVVIATLFTIMTIGRVLFGTVRSLLAGLLFALLLCTPVIEGNLAMTETFMILPVSLAVLAFLFAERYEGGRRLIGYAVAGLLIGVAVNYKQVAVFDGAALLLMAFLTGRRAVAPLVAMVGGFALPQVAFIALFIHEHAFSQYLYAVMGSLGPYSRLAPSQSHLLRAASYLPALFLAASLVKRRLAGEHVPLQEFPALWLCFAFAGATSSPYSFPHYLQQAAPAAALTMASLERPRRALLMTSVAKGAAALAIGVVIVSRFSIPFERTQLHPVPYYKSFVSYKSGSLSSDAYRYQFDGTVEAIDDIVGCIKEDNAGDTVYVWGEIPWLYVEGNFTNPTPYFTSFLSEVLPGAKARIMHDIEANPPVYVVVSENAFAPFDELRSFLDERYNLIHQENDWSIWRLSDLSGNLTLVNLVRP